GGDLRWLAHSKSLRRRATCRLPVSAEGLALCQDRGRRWFVVVEPVLALDIGGTKIAAGIVDAGGRMIVTSRIETPVGLDADGLWSTVANLVRQLRRTSGDLPLAGVGVGCGGPMVWPAGIVSPLNIAAWSDFPLREQLRELIPDVPVRVHNDAVAFAA